MFGPRLFITAHAVERFRERWAPGFTYGHAKRELMFLAMGAVRMRRKTRTGAELWLCKWDDHIVFVVARDAEHRRPVCVTILPAEPEQGVDADYPVRAAG